MVPHSLNGAYSDGASQVLWEDGERVFRRGWRLDDQGQRRAVLVVVPAADHSSRSSLERLTHEYELKDQLDGAWVRGTACLGSGKAAGISQAMRYVFCSAETPPGRMAHVKAAEPRVLEAEPEPDRYLSHAPR
jgi:hypothetical protein